MSASLLEDNLVGVVGANREIIDGYYGPWACPELCISVLEKKISKMLKIWNANYKNVIIALHTENEARGHTMVFINITIG